MATITEKDQDDDRDDAQHSTSEDVTIEADKATKAEAEIEVIEDDQRLSSESDDDAPVDTAKQREAVKETAKERRDRAKHAKARDKQELAFLRSELQRQDQRMRDLQQGQIVTRVTDLDNRISNGKNEVSTYERIEAAAIKAQNGQDAVDARRLREESQQKINQALWEKQQISQTQQQIQQPQQRAPAYEPLAREFLKDVPWYNANGTDEESMVLKAIDAAVAATYDPHDPAYWAELKRRAQARLPDKFKNVTQDDDDEDVDDPAPKQQRRGPPTGGSSRTSGSVNQIRLSPERVQAMKDVGAWDDPVARARYAKRYANYDKQNKQNSRG